MEVQKGDVIVMGSDGLFDNVFDHEIVSIVTKHADVAESCMYMYVPSLLILKSRIISDMVCFVQLLQRGY